MDRMIIVGIDMETTGLLEADEPVAVGMCAIDQQGNELASMEIRCRPVDRKIHHRAMAVHGIADGQLTSAIPPVDALCLFWKTIDGIAAASAGIVIVFAGHNYASFDSRFYSKYDCGKRRDVVDTLPLARKVFPDWEDHTLMGCAARLNLPRPAHEALTDARTTAHLYLALNRPLE